jgi:hypothetical protein
VTYVVFFLPITAQRKRVFRVVGDADPFAVLLEREEEEEEE